VHLQLISLILIYLMTNNITQNFITDLSNSYVPMQYVDEDLLDSEELLPEQQTQITSLSLDIHLSMPSLCIQLTNFTYPEIQELWHTVQHIFQSLSKRGRKARYNHEDSFFLTLIQLKHKQKWAESAHKWHLKLKSSAEELFWNIVNRIWEHRFISCCSTHRWRSIPGMFSSKNAFSWSCYILQSKTPFTYVIPRIGLAVYLNPTHDLGSVHELRIAKSTVSTIEAKGIIYIPIFGQSCGDKGYVGLDGTERCIIPKKSPPNRTVCNRCREMDLGSPRKR